MERDGTNAVAARSQIGKNLDEIYSNPLCNVYDGIALSINLAIFVLHSDSLPKHQH